MIGTKLGRYLIVDEVGRGAMGVVYRAEDLVLSRTVALKLLPLELAASAQARERLNREAGAASRLSHPHIAAIHEVNEFAGHLYVSMEFVDGQPLARRVEQGPLPLDEIERIGGQIADALEEAHRHGVIHRDVKPSNVMLDVQGRVKMVDFGLALQRTLPGGESAGSGVPTRTLRLTQEGSAVGTVAYMSPEQVRGETPDARGDLFSLGVVLYEMTTGKLPFAGSTALAMAAAILRDEPVSPREHRPETPAGLREVIQRCLAKSPAHRPASAARVRDALALLRHGGSATSLRRVLLPRTARRMWAPWLAASGIVVLVCAGTLAYLALRPKDRTPRDPRARLGLEQARQHAQRGGVTGLEQAERSYRQALSLEPENALVRAELARLLARIAMDREAGPERRKEIHELVDRALESDPGLAAAWEARGWLLLQEGDAKGAVAAGRQAIAADESYYPGHMVAGAALVDLGEHEAGLEELGRAAQLDREGTGARAQLALHLHELGRWDEAAAEYGKLLALSPDDTIALNNLGGIYLERGNYVESIPIFTRLLALEPDDFAASNLGTAYFHLDRMDDAVAAYRKAVELRPGDGLHEQNLGEALEKTGDAAAAREAFARALEDHDRRLAGIGEAHRPAALGDRAFCAAKLGRLDEALAGVEESLRLDPDAPNCLRAAARVQAIAGQRERAYALVDRALAAGYPPEDIRRDPLFAAYLDDPRFFGMLTGSGDP